MTLSNLDVSRETLDRLTTFHDLLIKWTPRINLISKATIPDIWHRHVWDSAQMYPLAKTHENWVDIGSGGGLPSLVIAILAREFHPEMHLKMIESDIRKATFLRTVVRELDLSADVNVARVEEADPENARVLSARALADLDTLLSFADRHLHRDGQALFFKGETWEKEVERARKSWSFQLVPHTSKTNPKASILEVREIQRV
ncbi:MAG: 16S rRNA (guanine(527)-N(7))-methyltransferase RsmG [Pseudomonadota bacterium]